MIEQKLIEQPEQNKKQCCLIQKIESFYKIIILYCNLLILGILVFCLYLVLVTFDVEKNDEIPINNFDNFNYNFTGNSKIQISDFKKCSKNQNACLKKKCQKDLFLNKEFNCEYKIHFNEEVEFVNFVLNCDSKDKCKVYFNSTNFFSQNLFLFGYDIDIESYQIESTNIFYDSYLGSFKVENLIFDQSFINTSFGDIVLETYDSVILNTTTKEQFVCLTCYQGWKNSTTQIKNLKEVFEERDQKQDKCEVIYRYQDRDQWQMVMEEQHSVFNNLTADNLINQDEVRCVEINNLILMNSDETPISKQNLKIIKASNYKGNIFVNIISDNSYQKPITNTFFENKNIKLSEKSAKDLNTTVRQILDEGKTNEIVYLDFRQTLEPSENFVFVLIFNAIYLHLTPAWLSSLSFSSLSSKDERKQMKLLPGLCPYIFSYNHFTNKQFSNNLVERNEKLILEVIKSFFEKERTEVQLVTTLKDYNQIKIRDKSSYPEIENIEKKIKWITITEVILIIVIAPIMIFIFSKIFFSLRDIESQKQLKDKAKIIFYFFQLQTLKQKQQSQSDQINQQKQHSQNQIKLQCEITSNNKKYNYYNFFYLSQKARIWLLTRYISSFELFLQSLIVKYDAEKYKQKQQTTQIDITQLKEGYQLFCFLFNLQEELILTEQLDNLMINSFKYQYKQIIVFKNISESKKQVEFLVQLSASTKMKIQDFIAINKEKFTEQMCFTEFMFQMNHTKEKSTTLNNGFMNRVKQVEFYNQDGQIKKSIIDRKNQQTMNIFENIQIQLTQISQQQTSDINKNNSIKMKKDSYYELATDSDDSIKDIYGDVDFFIYGEKTKVFAKTEEIRKEGEPDYILNKEFLQSIVDLSGDFLKEYQLKDPDSKNPEIIKISQELPQIQIQTQTTNDESYHQKNIKKKEEIDENYESLLEKSRGGENECIANYLQKIRTAFLKILFWLSPILGCLLAILFFVQFAVQQLKFQTDSYDQIDYQFYHLLNKYKMTKDLGFCFAIQIYCLIFIIISYLYYGIQIFILKKRSFTEVRFNSYYGKLQIIKEYNQKIINSEENEEKNQKSSGNYKRKIKKFFVSFYNLFVIIYNLINLFAIMFQIFYLVFAFVILVVGSIIFPKIQLPILIFFGSLIGVLIQMIVNFNSAIQCGRQKLKKKFQENFQKKYNNYIEKQKQNRLLEQQEQNRPQEQQGQNRPKEQQEQNRPQEQQGQNIPQKQKYQILKDVSIHTDHTFQSVFDYLEGHTDRNLTEKELTEFLKNIEMKLNQFQLDQLFSYIYIQENQEIQEIDIQNYQLNIWNLKKEINQRQFGLAIDFLISKKVKMALYILDISYPYLFLNLILIVFQSILFSSIVYFVYYGLSSNDAVLDFGSNSIVSVGSVVGIIFSKSNKDQSKVFEDEDAINSVIEKVELNMHEFN